MLSGEQLVSVGVTKIDATLPEIGMKDVLPNGSWLEKKQIQSALEARKHLIEVKRIEKCGVLSHAEWRDDLKLAEVTQQTGGYWQYYGHHIGQKLFLKPEEALFLIEVNSLLLKHNGITVSLQKAYALLLGDTITILQYKVFASLSRLGYKVFIHKELLRKDTICNKMEQNIDITNNEFANTDGKEFNSNLSRNIQLNTINASSVDRNNLTIKRKQNETASSAYGDTNVLITENIILNKATSINVNNSTLNSAKVNSNLKVVNKIHHIITSNRKIGKKQETQDLNVNRMDNNIDHFRTINDVPILIVDSDASDNIPLQQHDKFETMDISTDSFCASEINKIDSLEPYATKDQTPVQPLLKEESKSSKRQKLLKQFVDILDMFQKQTVIVNVPREKYIPKNIFVNNTSYKLNLDRIQKKNINAEPNEEPFNVSDEADESLKRIRNGSRSGTAQSNTSHIFSNNSMYPRMNQQFRPFWRPRNNLNYFQFNMFYQRPFMPRFTFTHRMNDFFRQFPNSGYANSNNLGLGTSRKRTRDEKSSHLEQIKVLALRFKQAILMGNRNSFNILSLQKLIFLYNAKFRCRLRLTDDFEIVDDSTILETIELEEEEEVSKRKKPKKKEDTFKDNLNRIRKMASRFKKMEANKIETSRPRKALSYAIGLFNKSYNADVYLNLNYEVIDRRHIALETSSDSDCCVEENEGNKSKKLPNPFCMINTIKNTMNSEQPSTSQAYNIAFNNQSQFIVKPNNKDSPITDFEKNWLPNGDDFGRREVPTNKDINTRILETYRDELLYDFIQNTPKKLESWVAAKIAFAKFIERTKRQFHDAYGSIENNMVTNEGKLRPIIGPNDSGTMSLLLHKLRIIATDRVGNKGQVAFETSLKIDFDVYNRDVPNFRKSNPPVPHFRVICIKLAWNMRGSIQGKSKHKTAEVPSALARMFGEADTILRANNIGDSSSFLSGEDVLGLHSKYNDGVAIVFAIVSISSISYLQINPTDIPLYIPCHDLA